MLGMRDGDIPNLLPYSEEGSVAMARSNLATVRLVGNLCKCSGGGRLSDLKVQVPTKLNGIISGLQEKHGLCLQRDNILILVNGVEANALDDLETLIQPNDEVVFIPMFHGGME